MLRRRHWEKVAGLEHLVDALPEVYQPILGHPEFDDRVSRRPEPRLAAIERVLTALAEPGRQLRVLDIGCAQGFISLSLALKGHQVTGIDREPRNVAVCEHLAAEHNLIGRAAFEVGSIGPGAAAALPAAGYDLVLALSVFHHLAHEQGAAAARETLVSLAQHCTAIIFEPGLATEPVYWAGAQPENPEDNLAGIPFVNTLGTYETHLSEVSRPLLLASTRLAFIDGRPYPFTHATEIPHSLGAPHGNRYFLSDTLVIKQVKKPPAGRDVDIEDAEREVDLLRRTVLPGAPRLVAVEDTPWALTYARESIPGALLSDGIQAGTPYDPDAVVAGVLDHLAELERLGLYHCDLRTWNVLIGDDGSPRLIDFGAIRESPDDVGGGDVWEAFLAFCYDVANRRLPPRADRMASRTSPYWFRGPLTAVAGAIDAHPEGVTFSELAQRFAAARRDPPEHLPPSADKMRIYRLERRLNRIIDFG